MFTEQLTVSCGWRLMADCASVWDHLATAASEVKAGSSPTCHHSDRCVFEKREWWVKSVWCCFCGLPEHWESHTDLPEIRALQGRTPEYEGMGDENDDVSDDEDEDEEDQGFDHLKETEEEQQQPDFIVNMYNALRESECEWQQREAQAGRGSALRLGSSVCSPSWTCGLFLNLHSLCSSSSLRKSGLILWWMGSVSILFFFFSGFYCI